MAARNWTEEQRRTQSIKIFYWKPWATSTGPRTIDGLAKSSKNSRKHGLTVLVSQLSLILSDLENKG